MTLNRVNTDLDRIAELAERITDTEAETARLRGQLAQAMQDSRATNTVQQIADAAGITRERCHAILRRHQDTQQARSGSD